MDCGLLRPVPTGCLKIDAFLFLWCIYICTTILRAVLIVTTDNVLFLINCIILHNFRLDFLSACLPIGLLCVRLVKCIDVFC